MQDATFYTLKRFATELGEDQDVIREFSVDMFSEGGCFTAYNNYPVKEEVAARSTGITLRPANRTRMLSSKASTAG